MLLAVDETIMLSLLCMLVLSVPIQVVGDNLTPDIFLVPAFSVVFTLLLLTSSVVTTTVAT